MGATGGRGRLLRRGWLPVCAAVLLAGCASMPSSGEVRKVGDGQRADADSQVRVFGIAPHDGENTSQIVSGFLEATTSGETDFSTAKKYLTKEMAARWDPTAQITVFSSGRQSPDADSISRKEGYATVSLSGTKAAVVDTKHAYLPDQGEFRTSFHLVKQNNEWRIDGLRDGLVLSEPDFQRLYHSVNMYYFAKLGPDEHPDGSTVETLVADPVYLRNQTDPLVSTVSALLGGPTDWLSPAVTSAAPSGIRLYDKAPDHGVTLDDSQRLRVRLDHSADRMGGQRCARLAAQLFATVQAQASAKLASADVERADGSLACSLPSGQAQTYGPENRVGSATRQYYIGSDSQRQHPLLELGQVNNSGSRVTGPLGDNKADLDSVAVRRDEQVAAGVRNNGRELVVGSLVYDEPLGDPVIRSNATTAKDGLSAPSWDGFDDLWVADRDPKAPKLLVLPDGRGPAVEASVENLEGRVESLRVASDGVRIALVVEQDKVMRLLLGRIVRGGTLKHPQFSVTGLRMLTPPGENVTSVSWAGASRLVLLDRESGGAQRIEYMSTDGSTSTALQGVSEAASVAASEDQTKPLLASYNGSVYRLGPDNNWKQVTPKGGSPVYPG